MLQQIAGSDELNRQRWEYCILSCTPMPILEEEGARIVGQVFAPDGVRDLDIRTAQRSPLDAIARGLNEMGQEGWELVAYDTSTNRGVFKRALLL